uniref:Translation initiation factor eIF2B subunit gamma n=1 Tax=Parasteatoda tepidariorum TaxID=114398 RepID=A0A2L2YEP3_PARTP
MEFQAVIMAAGTGSRMRELMSSVPKCLLPVGNVPLIMCSLNILKRAGFAEAIVIVRETEKLQIQTAIEDKTGLNLDIVALPRGEDWGTADSLRFIKDKIKQNVIVLSCDLVSDFNLQDMINLHRVQSSSLTMLLVPFPKSLREVEMPGSKKKCKFERDIIGLDPTNRLIFINSEADFEENVPLRMKVIQQYPNIKVHSNLMDAHLYIIQKDLIHFIMMNQHISTLKGEFLPAAVKKQFSLKKKNRNSDLYDPTVDKDWIDLKSLAFELSSCHIASTKNPDAEENLVCYSYVDKDCFCSRVNNLVAYAEINKKLIKHFNLVTGQELKSHEFQKSQVDGESIVGDDCELAAKASVKQSMIGNDCKFDERAKTVNSIVMNNVSIGKECSIQGSIICSNVVLEERCSLKNCVVASDQIIKSMSKLNNEIFQGTEQLMQI